MEMREIKFRAWIPSTEYMWSWESLVRDKAHLAWLQLEPEYGEKVIMQYTGLKDKNGVEIYEGDILYKEITAGNFGSVVVQFKDARFQVSGTETNLGWIAQDAMKVIGNIHENPDLLKE